MRLALTFFSLAFLAGCAGKYDYVRPSSYGTTSNSKVVDKPRDAVWAASVPALSKQFFVINNIDKASGLINVSYSGDPERYVDCGRITSFVQNARGERTYDFPGAKAHMAYEVMNPGAGLFFIERKMALEGRVNLIFEEVSPTQTRVTANTRYVVNRSQVVRSAANNIPNSRTDTVSFNSGSAGAFPAMADGRAAECAANGALEREVLSQIN